MKPINEGGSYIIHKPGDEPELVERTEMTYPDGGPRDANGKRLDGKHHGRHKKPDLKAVKTADKPASKEADITSGDNKAAGKETDRSSGDDK